MPVELQDYHKIKRQIKVSGIDRAVILIITRDGIEFKVAGAKRGVTQTWSRVIAGCETPEYTYGLLRETHGVPPEHRI